MTQFRTQADTHVYKLRLACGHTELRQAKASFINTGLGGGKPGQILLADLPTMIAMGPVLNAKIKCNACTYASQRG